MPDTPRELLDSPEFHRLVVRRWTMSLVLTAVLFLVYYGFILLVALDRTLLARRIGGVTTVGIVLGVAVIGVSWLLAVVYARWAKRIHDPAVETLRNRLER